MNDLSLQNFEIPIICQDKNILNINLMKSDQTLIKVKDLLSKVNEIILKDLKDNQEDNFLLKVFSLYLTSPLLEINLKEDYQPFCILEYWYDLIKKFSHNLYLKKNDIFDDEPKICLKKNIFLLKSYENKIKDEFILKLLYEEAKENFLIGKYIKEDQEKLAVIQIKIDLLINENHEEINKSYLKNNINKYLSNNYLLKKLSPFISLNKVKNNLSEQILRLLNNDEYNLTLIELYKKYLNECHSLPFYGSIFFDAQIERNSSVFSSLLSNHDMKIWVAINFDGLHIIDKKYSNLIISLPFNKFQWEIAVSKNLVGDLNSLPCLFIEFENNETSNKKMIIQIFSKQAKLMDNTLIEFDKINSNKDVVDANCSLESNNVSICENLCKVNFATFNNKGVCVKKQGSLKVLKTLK